MIQLDKDSRITSSVFIWPGGIVVSGVTDCLSCGVHRTPGGYADRAALWDAVGKIEKAKNAPARKIEIALPQELTGEQGIFLVRGYMKRHFVAAGMCADFRIHDKQDGTHAHIMPAMRLTWQSKAVLPQQIPYHIMLTIYSTWQAGAWGAKQKKEYIPAPPGQKIYDTKKRSQRLTAGTARTAPPFQSVENACKSRDLRDNH